MDPDNTQEPIKITLEDIAGISASEASPAPAIAGSPDRRSYGTIAEAAEPVRLPIEERGSILLQGWFYLGFAGLLGAFAGWALAEPAFVDGAQGSWGNTWIVPLILALMSLGFGIAESVVERSVRKAFLRGVLSLPLGIVLGFVFYFVANIVYAIGLEICREAGVLSERNPAVWITRGVAWAVFGAAGGIVYGIIGQSMKKGTYGVLGGMIGAGIGGTIFDPIAIFTEGGGVSRAVGFALVGVATGLGMGIVESALKHRWLYVTSGPLAGKQFILYQSRTVIGSAQGCDIYLFKDSTILPQHAVIEISGSRAQVRAAGNVYWMGQPVSIRVLQHGDLIQVGRYSFRYQEKHRS